MPSNNYYFKLFRPVQEFLRLKIFQNLSKPLFKTLQDFFVTHWNYPRLIDDFQVYLKRFKIYAFKAFIDLSKTRLNFWNLSRLFKTFRYVQDSLIVLWGVFNTSKTSSLLRNLLQDLLVSTDIFLFLNNSRISFRPLWHLLEFFNMYYSRYTFKVRLV